jgi:hypothetical protein
MTVAQAKVAVEALREKYPLLGNYKLARKIYIGYDVNDFPENTYDIFTVLGSEYCFYRILNFVRRYDARQKKQAAVVAV